MKNCCEINEWISLYTDNMLDRDSLAEFEEHIVTCRSCRKELEDTACVVGACKDLLEDDLPVNFKDELHDRLIREKEKHEQLSKTALMRNRYIRICSTVAACLLIAVLAKGLLFDNYFNLSGANMGAKSESAAPNQIAAAKDEMIASNSSEIKRGESNEQFGIIAKSKEDFSGEVERVESARSAQTQNRTDALSMGSGTSKAAMNRNENILISTDGDTGVIVEKVLKLAADNAAEYYDENMLKSSDTSDTAKYDAIGNEAKLNFKVKNSLYEQFISSLKAGFNSADIEIGIVNEEDLSVKMNELNTKLNEFNSKIDTARKNENTSNTEEMDRLKAERDGTIAEIENMQLDSDYTFIYISIREK